MAKEIEQHKNEAQELAMARAALGRVNEMDLKPNELKKIMEMLDQASHFEKSGQSHKALYVYLNVKSFLDKIKNQNISGVAERTKDNHEVLIFFSEELEKSKKFFEKQGVDWGSWPDEILIDEKQQNEMKRCIREFGFNKIMIIPGDLADTGDKLSVLHGLMTKYYSKTIFEPRYDKYVAGKSQERRNKSRIILYRQQPLPDDVYIKTRDHSAEALMSKSGLIETLGLDPISEAEFLVLQQRHFLNFPADFMFWGDEILLLGSNLEKYGFPTEMVITAHWDLSGEHSSEGLCFNLQAKNFTSGTCGCPLVKIIDIDNT